MNLFIPITRIPKPQEKIKPPKILAETLLIIDDEVNLEDDKIDISEYSEDLIVTVTPIEEPDDEVEEDNIFISVEKNA